MIITHFIKKNYKMILINLFLSLFISCFIEKFCYPNASFDIIRAICSLTTTFIINIIIFDNMKNKNQSKLTKKIDKIIKNISKTFKENIKNTNVIKYGFAIIITLYVTYFYKEIYYIIFGSCEIFIIAIISNIIIQKHHKTGLIINDILMFLYNINIAVLIFGGTFVSSIMLTNLDSLEDLSGKAEIYILGALLVLAFSIIPIKAFKIKKRYLFITLIYEIILVLIVGLSYSVFCNYCLTTSDLFHYVKVQNYVKHHPANKKEFYQKEVKDYIKKDKELTEKPNIILIFTEGFSRHIIYDERKIMPNVYNYMDKSINFAGYYNHTAATYRGLIGQLYSGYQLNNTDKNQLISIQNILEKEGYETEFINVEPNNETFTKYLKSFKFKNFVSENDKPIYDKKAYEMIFDEATKLNENSEPFFLSLYTFGTHVSFDSDDVKYGNGKNNELNKFYNLDYQFGKFMEKMKKSSLYDNTIIILTSDHGTYMDEDYLKTFENRPYSFVDEIPLMIYHKNIKPQTIEVNGRNSLDLAPTILDYIDVSRPNYFLGTSLFSDKGNKYDTTYSDMMVLLSSKNKELVSIENDEIVQYNINSYYSVAMKKN